MWKYALRPLEDEGLFYLSLILAQVCIHAKNRITKSVDGTSNGYCDSQRAGGWWKARMEQIVKKTP